MKILAQWNHIVGFIFRYLKLKITDKLIMCKNEIRFLFVAMIGTCAEGHQWTKWYKGESNTRGFDARLSVLKRKENWHCKSTPSAINVQLENSREPYIMGKNKFSWISPEKGVLCKNNQQSENIKCKKYRVSFCCTLK